jgi:hypothetical protein
MHNPLKTNTDQILVTFNAQQSCVTNTHRQFPAGYSQSLISHSQSLIQKSTKKTPANPIENKQESQPSDWLVTDQSLQRDNPCISMGYDQSLPVSHSPLIDPPTAHYVRPFAWGSGQLAPLPTNIHPGPVHKAPGYEVALS